MLIFHIDFYKESIIIPIIIITKFQIMILKATR